MLLDPLFPPSNWCVRTLALVCFMEAGGCADPSPSLGLAAFEVTTESLTINSGAAYTRNTSATLTMTTPPANTPVKMCVSNTSTCTFEPFTRSKRWLLTSGDGPKTVSVTLQDRLGNQTPLQASVQLDTTVPVAGSLTATPSDARVSLAWDAAMDALSGIQSYRLMMSPTITPPSCSYGQLIYQGTDTSYEHTTVRNGSTYGYRICPIDLAGNIGVGETALARPAPEYDPPTGSVVINGGALLTRSFPVTLELDATDASAIAAICISQTPVCSNWVAWSSTKAWTLRGPNGLATVNVWFRDIYANTSAPATATITLDTLSPSLSTLTTLPGRDGVALSWTAATDLNAVASYTLVWMAGTLAPASCSVGNVAYMGLDLAYSDPAGPTGFRSYRLCATDEAGNVNVGTTKTVVQPSNALAITAVSSIQLAGSAIEPGAITSAEDTQSVRFDLDLLTEETAGLSRSELMRVVHEHILQTVEHAREPLQAVSVASEAIDDDTLQLRAGIYATLGIRGLAQVYKWLEEADPDVRLYYDDYGIDGSSAKTAAVYGLVRDLIAQGARIDGIGMRARFDSRQTLVNADRH